MYKTLISGASVMANPALTSAPRVCIPLIAPAAHPLCTAKVATALFVVALVQACLAVVFKPLTHLRAGVITIDSLGCLSVVS